MLGLQVCPGNKVHVLPVERRIISLTEKSMASEVH